MVQQVNSEDQTIAQGILNNKDMLQNVFLSVEAYFSLDGVVNRHNMNIFAHEIHML